MKITALQLNSTDDIDNNLSIIERAISQSARLGTQLLVLPENAAGMPNQHAVAMRADSITSHYQYLAKTHGIALIAGTLPIQHGNKFYQRSLAIDTQGKIIACYDKKHLFYANVNGVVYDEAQRFIAGSRVVVANFDDLGVRVGMMICFDVRFDMACTLSKMGADIIACPSAFTYPTGKKHWQSLMVARALDSQCMMVGANQVGLAGERRTWGQSMIVDADGQVHDSAPSADDHTNDYADNPNHDFALASGKFDKHWQYQIRQALPIGNPC